MKENQNLWRVAIVKVNIIVIDDEINSNINPTIMDDNNNNIDSPLKY